MKYYIAYGSNTPQEMKYRCPDSQFLGRAKLSNHRLLFRQYATIEPAEGEDLEVMLYKISKKDEINLDYYESYPHFYDKKKVDVIYDNKVFKAIVYFLSPSRYYSIRIPDASYLGRCFMGYVNSGIDIRQLVQAYIYTDVESSK